MMQRTYFPRPIFPALARKTRQGHPTSVVANNPIPTYFQPTPNLFLARNILKKAKTSSEISPRPLRPPRSRRVLRGIVARVPRRPALPTQVLTWRSGGAERRRDPTVDPTRPRAG